MRQQATHPLNFCVQWRTESICNRCPTVCTVKFWNKTENDSAKTIFLSFSRFNLITFFVIFSFCMLSLKYIFWERTGRTVLLCLPILRVLMFLHVREVLLYFIYLEFYCTCLYVELYCTCCPYVDCGVPCRKYLDLSFVAETTVYRKVER